MPAVIPYIADVFASYVWEVVGSELAYDIAYAAAYVAASAAIAEGINELSRQDGGSRPLGGELNLAIDSDFPRQMIIGERPVAGSLVAHYSNGDNSETLLLVYALADHPCAGLTAVYGDGGLVNGALTHGVQTEITAYSYSGGPRVFMTFYDGRPGQTADAELIGAGPYDAQVVAGLKPGWSSTDVGAGVAYVVVKVYYDSDILLVPPRFLFLVKGAPLYDRRLDSTAGGSGANRLDDPSTWEWTDNPAVALDHFLLGYQVEDENIAFGVGLLPSEVPYDRFAAAADLSDEDIETGTDDAIETIKRFRANGLIGADQGFEDIIDSLRVQMAARVVDLGGTVGILAGEERTPVCDLSDQDLVAGETVEYADKLAFVDLIGAVEGRYADPGNLWQPVDYERQVGDNIAFPDGGEAQTKTLDLPFETNPRRAVRLARADLEREAIQPRLSGRFMPMARGGGSGAWKLEAGDWFTYTDPLYQIEAESFEVLEIAKNSDFSVTLTARAVSADFLAFDNDNDPDLSVPVDQPPVTLLLALPTFDIEVSTLTAGGVVEPCLEVTLTSDETLAREIVVEYGKWDGADVVGPTLVDSFHVSQVVTKIRKGILPSTDYVLRMKAKAGPRESPWTDWSDPETTGATYRVGSAASVPWSGVTDDDGHQPDDDADVTSGHTAAAIAGQGDLATADRASLPFGVNAVVNADLARGMFGWLPGGNGSAGGTWSGGVNSSGARNIFAAQVTGTPTAGLTFDIAYSDSTSLATLKKFALPVAAGDRVFARALAGIHRVSALQVKVGWYDASGAYIAESIAASGGRNAGTGGRPSDYDEVAGFLTAPTNTCFASLFFRAVVSGGTTPYCEVLEPLLARVPSGQTQAIPYHPGGQDPLGDQTAVSTASAITGQGLLATLSALTTAIANASDLLRYASGGLFTGELAADQTSGHTAAAIASQGAFATLSAITSTLADANNLLRKTSGGLFSGELNADLTSGHTAAAITSQGSLATLSSLAYGGAYLSGFGTLAALSSASGLTAGGITGQGALATLNTVNSSGLLDAGVVSYTALATTAVRLGTNIVKADGSTSVTDSLVVTSLGTASAISGQGSFATLSSVALTSSMITSKSLANLDATASTKLSGIETSADVTGSHTASAIASQGALATRSLVTGAYLGAGIGKNLLLDTGFLRSGNWTKGSSGGSVSGSPTSLGDFRYSQLSGSGLTAGQYIFEYPNTYVPVMPGETLEASFYYGIGSATAQVWIQWFGASGYISQSLGVSPGGGPGGGGTTLGDWYRVGVIGVAPAGAVKALFVAVGQATASSPALAYTLPFMARASAGQTELSAWNQGVEAEPGADITSTHTASAIAGQTFFATATYLALNTTYIRKADGSTTLTESLVITTLGVSSAISGQGSLATRNDVATGHIQANAVTSGDIDEVDTPVSLTGTYQTVATLSGVVVPDSDTFVDLSWSVYLDGANSDPAHDCEVYIEIVRGSTQIYETIACRTPSVFEFFTTETGQLYVPGSFIGQVAGFDGDQPGAGTYTYTLKAKVTNSGGFDISKVRFKRLLFKR